MKKEVQILITKQASFSLFNPLIQQLFSKLPETFQPGQYEPSMLVVFSVTPNRVSPLSC